MRDLRRASAMIGALALGCVAMTGCKGTSTIGGEGGGGSSGTASGGGGGSSPVSAPRKVDKVDIVLGVDNSASMADKQQVLALAMADMISSLTEPPCFDASGALVGPSLKGDCSEGTHTVYAAIRDIHIGVVTSSLGGHGSDACSTAENPQNNNDAGHLIDRGPHGVVPTYQNKGFLAWDPLHKQNPPGDDDAAAFTGKIRDLVAGAGQDGCGYESQLESWYRFLADPDPSASISANGPTFVPSGTDQTLLAQRAAFLRPDSLLVIMMLSDENDCSVQESGFNPIVLNSGNGYHLPAPRAICATDPNDRCCGSCGVDAPAGCPVDPTCDDGRATLDEATDPLNLRCFDQKRRFGVDFLYPTSRYVSALSTTVVANRGGDLVRNPIFSRLPGQDPNAPLRDPGLVVLASISGAPWQDLARDPNDLTKGFKDDTELSAPTVSGHTTWDEIVGDPTQSIAPKDPFMIESQKARSGSNPFTNDAILPPNSEAMNRINGHEWNTSENSNGDLEYACDFVLPTPVDCAAAGAACDCPSDSNATSTTDPLCSTQSVTTQVRAKAYPGLRQLAVLKGLAAQGVAASICPSNLADSSRSDYVYRPAMRAVIERVAGRLAH